MNEIFDKITAWINYVTDWVIYVAQIFKAIGGAINTLRSSWPDKPSLVRPGREEKQPAGTDIINADKVGDITTNGENVGGS